MEGGFWEYWGIYRAKRRSGGARGGHKPPGRAWASWRALEVATPRSDRVQHEARLPPLGGTALPSSTKPAFRLATDPRMKKEPALLVNGGCWPSGVKRRQDSHLEMIRC
uniref:Uncharacterized protein n=1 Tax=Aegilops tauschii TaxID=37682 RepID=M8CZL1_AEGTA